MRTYKGIVCEKNKHDMIFMTGQGEFLRGIPLRANADIGDEVEFRLMTTSPRRFTFKYLAPALVAALIMLILTSSLFQSNNVYATIQLDGEKSIELSVDKKGHVVSVRSLNDEDIKLSHFEGKPVDEVIPSAIAEISPNGEIQITTKYDKQKDSKLNEKIEKAVKQVEKKQQNTKPAQERNKTNMIEKQPKNEITPNNEKSVPKTSTENKKTVPPKEQQKPQNNNIKEKQTPSGQEKAKQQHVEKEKKVNENSKQPQNKNEQKPNKQKNNEE
ncbi:hypothetical protein SAMN05880501_11665 [Ureibacillus xyleni]|uniref:RsgI N-terminal anti-sigma domain-containing protein n=1 Tax=Ureibacillus xyleni TaxID=614648 RepID=A0A285TMY7_9BACL|nr:anti-sigma factor domain-containing protein [Ureibacillus xyleni]SOC23997.1 hypothetical protein SAMN05880501_11665 [Ureibacillus xyleni]